MAIVNTVNWSEVYFTLWHAHVPILHSSSQNYLNTYRVRSPPIGQCSNTFSNILKELFINTWHSVNRNLIFESTHSATLIGHLQLLITVASPVTILALLNMDHQSSWKSKKQASVAIPTCEAEYVLLSITCQEIIYLARLVNELIEHDLQPSIIKNDNQGALSLIKNPVKHLKS